MGIYSTKTVTRQRAIASLINNIQRATNEELEEMLFAAFAQKTLNNYRVEDSEPEEEEDPFLP